MVFMLRCLIADFGDLRMVWTLLTSLLKLTRRCVIVNVGVTKYVKKISFTPKSNENGRKCIKWRLFYVQSSLALADRSVPLWRPLTCILFVFVLRGRVPSRVPPPRWNCYGTGHAFREGGDMSVFCSVFLPLVSLFGLFPVLVKCHY